jgi:pSer/pThr/pTyr-binding forkhead associated (FHA) protein
MWLVTGSLTRELRDGEVMVGSGADADWRVPTADLMPCHFTITVHGLNASLKPASNDNVVAVNGKQLAGAPYLLNDGDVIAAGSGRFVFFEESPKPVAEEPPVPGRAFLVNESASVAHELVSRSTPIGRDVSNSIVVRDPGASRFHAELRREAGGFALHSMGSSGTMRNGQRIDGPVLLAEGDVIEVAYAKFRFTTTPPPGMAIAALSDARDILSRRNPTLATGKISVVPASGGPLSGRMVGLIVAALIVAGLLILKLTIGS